MQDSIRAKLHASSDGVAAPSTLKSRVCAELRDEQRAQRGASWRIALPLSLAVAVVAILGMTQSTAPALQPDEAVVRHTRNVLPEVRARGSQREVQRFVDHRLGRSVPLPETRDRNLRLVGVRVSSPGQAASAHLMYDHRGARVSVFANERPGAMDIPPAFERRLVQGQPIFVGRHRGYNLVATRRDDVLYRFVSDLDNEALVRFATSVHR